MIPHTSLASYIELATFIICIWILKKSIIIVTANLLNTYYSSTVQTIRPICISLATFLCRSEKNKYKSRQNRFFKTHSCDLAITVTLGQRRLATRHYIPKVLRLTVTIDTGKMYISYGYSCFVELITPD